MLYVEPWPLPDLRDCVWYHTLDLPGGTVTGEWDLRGRFDDYTGRVDLSGKRVLDIGTASGFLTWEAEKRGAQVVSFDLDHASRQKLLPFRESIYMVDRDESERQREVFFNSMKRGYWHCHHVFGSRAQVHYGNIERLPLELGRFDVALLCSVLEHLPDHIQEIASAGALADTLVLTGPLAGSDDRRAEFAGFAGHPEANYSFWRYSIGVYREVFAMLGFSITRVTRSSYRHMSTPKPIEIPTIVAQRA
jgi:SAM-dependent methyltransferase